jgi:hypothetical protein
MKKIKKKTIVIFIIGFFIVAGFLPNISSYETFNDTQDQEQRLEDDYGYRLCWNWTQAQSFIPQLNILTRVEIKLFTIFEDTNDTLKISIRKSLENKDLTNITKMLDFTSDQHWIEFDFEDIVVNVGEPYYIVCNSLNNTPYQKCYGWLYAWGEGIKPGPYQDGCCYYTNDRYTWLNLTSYNDDLCFVTYGYNEPSAKSDLECNGRLNWNFVGTKENVEGNFSLKNTGFSGSLLDWYISEHPSWGSNWSIYPYMGNDLTPSDGTQIINVKVDAPEKQHDYFSGEIKIVNNEDPSDSETIVVTLSTSKNKQINTPFLDFLEKHPRLFIIIRQLFGL